MAYKGILFDFNGTLFQDTEFHLKAWRQYSKKLRGYPFTDEEMVHHMLGRTNDLIIEYCIGKKPDKEFCKKCGEEKEALYREILSKSPENINLAKGAVKFLDYLKEKKIPINIATGSEKTNLAFYIKIFNLDKWFDIEKIVFDNGEIKGKPNPDIYLKAAENLNLNPKDCIVFEDALAGVIAAKKAKVGKIYLLAEKSKHDFFKKYDDIDEIIEDFSTLNFSEILSNHCEL